jgi:poly(A) polymerase Pap1
MSLIIYLIGFAFVIGGIAWALIVAGVPPLYVMITAVILVGIAILTGVTHTRTKD